MGKYLQRHVQTALFSLGKLYRRPVATVLTATVIGITLALPAGLHLMMQNVNSVGYSWEGTLKASLFLNKSVDEAAGQALARRLQSEDGVANAQYISRAQALEEFKALSGFGQALDLLNDNPLPAVIVVQPRTTQTPEQIDSMMRKLSAIPEVEQAKLDQQWLDRLFAILSIVQRGVLIIALLLAVAVVLTVGNTIRLDIENRRDEIVIMKLVGASDAFVRRPFLYTGFWYGLLGTFVAFVFVTAAVILLAGPAAKLSGLYQSSFVLQGLGFSQTLLLFAVGVGLGWFGAFWTVARHLGSVVPR